MFPYFLPLVKSSVSVITVVHGDFWLLKPINGSSINLHK